MTAAAALPSEFRRTVLPNGLTVLSEFMPGVRSVAFGGWVRAASLHEDPARLGVSHLLEHMVFKGSERRSAKELALALEVLGGSLDAYTTKEHTVYQARVLAEHLGVAADVIGDLCFRPLLRESDLLLERKVILEEIGMMEDTPDDLVFEVHGEQLWGTHPYGWSILGTRDTVNALGVAELRELHQRAYTPRQMVVTASGAVHHEQLLEALLAAGWGDREPGAPERLTSPPPVTAPPTRRDVEREGAQTHIVVGTDAPAQKDPRRHALILLSQVLGGGMSSRLFQRVREELGLAYSVYTYHDFHADTGMHGVYVATAPEQAEEALEAITDELRRVAEQGIPGEELAQARSQLRGQTILGLESVTGRMYQLAGVELYDEPYRTLDEMLAIIDGISAEDVAAIGKDYFSPDRMTVVTLGPGA
ncbi:MAG TPA: pitrilysin family protein [Gemmatimonadaceae bacterium]